MGRIVLALLGLLALACANVPGLAPTGSQAASPAPVLTESPPADLPAPQGMRAYGSELRAVPLRWEPLLSPDAAGYVVERAEPGQERFARIATLRGRFQTSHIDRGSAREAAADGATLEDGATYRYRVRAFDTSLRLAATASDEVLATTAPAPAPPDQLRAYSHLPRRVVLTWLPAEDPLVRGYAVYRSPSEAGEYAEIGRTLGRHRAHFTDDGLGDLRVLHYRVAAVNAAGGEGPPSESVRAVTKAEPLPPLGLAVGEQRLGANRLVWEPNVERDVLGYRLLRLRTGRAAPQAVATLDDATTEAWDEAVAAGEVVRYQLLAFDRDGLVSEPSEPLEVTSQGYELDAEAAPGAVRLRWRARPDEGFAAARVLREGWLGWEPLGRAPDGRWTDASVSPGRSYRYRVVLERTDGSPAPPSQVLEVTVPTETAAR